MPKSGEIDFHRIHEEIYGSFDYNRGMEIDPARTALVIVDMQPAFSTAEMGMAKAYSKILKIGIDYFEDRVQNLVLPNTARLLEFFRGQKMLVVYIVTWSETEDLIGSLSMGHGIGLNIHEMPDINLHNDAPVREGMVLSIEPWVLDRSPSGGLFNMEDMVVVRSDGAEALNGEHCE